MPTPQQILQAMNDNGGMNSVQLPRSTTLGKPGGYSFPSPMNQNVTPYDAAIQAQHSALMAKQVEAAKQEMLKQSLKMAVDGHVDNMLGRTTGGSLGGESILNTEE